MGDKVLLESSQTIVDENGPVDWNDDGDQTDLDVAIILADRNGDDVIDAKDNPKGGEVLKGYDDWSNLSYDFRDSAGFADGVHTESTLDTEMTFANSRDSARSAARASSLRRHPDWSPPNRVEVQRSPLCSTPRPKADVTIRLSSSNSGEGTVSPSSLTFTTANWNVLQRVTVTGVDDQVVDGNVVYTIVARRLSAATSITTA